MDYKKLLEESCAESAPEFVCKLMEIYPYETGGVDEPISRKACQVARAITERKTFEYIEDEDNLESFIMFCHIPFFADRIEWGCSIRGAWWDSSITLKSDMLYDSDGEQITHMDFDQESWNEFILAICDFLEGA